MPCLHGLCDRGQAITASRELSPAEVHAQYAVLSAGYREGPGGVAVPAVAVAALASCHFVGSELL